MLVALRKSTIVTATRGLAHIKILLKKDRLRSTTGVYPMQR